MFYLTNFLTKVKEEEAIHTTFFIHVGKQKPKLQKKILNFQQNFERFAHKRKKRILSLFSLSEQGPWDSVLKLIVVLI